MKNYVLSEVISTVVTVSFKTILKYLLEKLNLPQVLFLCEKHRLDHDPTFIAYTNLDDGYGRHIIYGGKTSTKKKAAQEAAFKVISHRRNIYDFVVRDMNYKDLKGLEYDHEELIEMYKKMVEHDALKEKLATFDNTVEGSNSNYDMKKEYTFRSHVSAIRDFPPGCEPLTRR